MCTPSLPDLGLREPPYYAGYGKTRLLVHNVVTSKYFDLAIAAVIGLNVITMAMEFYMMPKVDSTGRNWVSSSAQILTLIFVFTGVNVCVENFQLFFYRRIRTGIAYETGGVRG